MNNICLSTCGKFVELWHNGQKIRWHGMPPMRLHEAVAELREYIRKWAGDEAPTIDPQLAKKMQDADAALQSMAFGAQWR